MRNPLNSWNKSDSEFRNAGFYISETGNKPIDAGFFIGGNDYKLMKQLVKAGTDHSKFMRMITVTMDITAPLYWWKEYDTYKVGTVANSCSTMHTIAQKEFTPDDFSHEHLTPMSIEALEKVIKVLNFYRETYIAWKTSDEKLNIPATASLKEIWWQMIQLLPSSYNQKRTVQLNYQVLRNMYHARKNHKLDEWRDFCEYVKSLPYSELITMEG